MAKEKKCDSIPHQTQLYVTQSHKSYGVSEEAYCEQSMNHISQVTQSHYHFIAVMLKVRRLICLK